MELKYRRIYAYTFVIVFILIAPLLIFYTEGYRYDFKKGQIVRTGVLNVDSNPRDATIVLNGKTIKNKTQAIIKNLPPQEYQITIKKESYYEWEKKLLVFPNQATLTNRITLFKNSSPSLLLDEQIDQFKISPDNSSLAYLTKNEQNKLYFVLQRLSDSSEITRLPLVQNGSYSFSFSENNSYLFLWQEQDNKRDYQIIFLKTNQKPLALSKISALNFSTLKAPSGSEAIYGLCDGKLYEIDLAKNSSKLIIDDLIQDYTIFSKNVYYLYRDQKKCLLEKTGLDGKLNRQELLTLPCSTEYSLENGANHFLTLLSNNHQLSLIELQGELAINLKQLNPSVLGFNWSPDQKKIIFYNEFEIWVLDLETEGQELLIRSSEPIENVAWNYDPAWIVFYQAETIKTIELDSRDKRNVIDLVNCPNSDFMVDVKQARIIFKGSKNNPTRLYQLELK